MKFYMTPGSCTTGIHILLEELDLAFEVYPVNLLAGDNKKPEFLALNPKGTIPLLVKDDGTPLTDFGAIATWLARKYPRRGLVPSDLDQEARVLEVLNYAVGVIHGQGFARVFTTNNFAQSEADHDAVIAQGKEIVVKAFEVLNAWLSGREYVVDTFSIADAALFYTEFWADKTGVAMPEYVDAHYRTMLTRPAVRRVLAEEGYRVG